METFDQELVPQLEHMRRATEAGKIVWSQQNPTTYLWVAASPNARVTIQKVARPVVAGQAAQSPYYLLVGSQVVGSQWVNKPTINGSERPSLNDLLKDLFAFVADRTARDSLQFLTSLLPPA